jgi:hypothetical protein
VAAVAGTTIEKYSLLIRSFVMVTAFPLLVDQRTRLDAVE